MLSHLNVVVFRFVSLFLRAKSSLHSIKILKQKSINIFKIICFLFYLWLLFYYWLVFCSEKSIFAFVAKPQNIVWIFLEIFVKRCFFFLNFDLVFFDIVAVDGRVTACNLSQISQYFIAIYLFFYLGLHFVEVPINGFVCLKLGGNAHGHFTC